MVDLAIETYFRMAYGSEKRRRGESEGGGSQDPFQAFVDETRPSTSSDAPPLQRYTMRLGNRSYPFMKLVLQEHIVAGEFYFSVDTHDQFDIRPDYPDYEGWMKVKRFNLDLKRQIEEGFAAAGLPTFATIVDAVAGWSEAKPTASSTILVVDDEIEEARALERLLQSRGFEVILAGDGREALNRLATLRPALIILDYEMPELDGLAVIHELRSHPETRHLPILLTTASQVLQSERTAADGFLPKPFRSGELLDLVDRLLGRG